LENIIFTGELKKLEEKAKENENNNKNDDQQKTN
jgi:hypothetical protein